MAINSAENSESKSTKKTFKFKHPKILIFVVFIILFASFGAYLYMTSRAAGTASMSALPANQTAQVGNNITVTIQEDSINDVVNAIQADLTYDQTKLEFVSVNVSAPFDAMVTQKTGGNGVVHIAAATSSAVSGSHTLATVTFKVTANGSAAINFANTSAIIRQSDISNVLGIMNGAVIAIGTPTTGDNNAPSTPGNPRLVSSNKTSITFSWAASTDDVGVAGYNIYRDGVLINKTSSNRFTDTGLTFKRYYSYSVSAYDNSGKTSPVSAATSFKATIKKYR